MANPMRQPTPPNGIHPHHSMPVSHVNHVNGVPNSMSQKTTPQHLQQLNEAVWIGIGNVSELMGDLDGAIGAYERALLHNQYSVQAMNQISCILRTKENFPRAVEYLQAILKLDQNNGEVWGSLGHCFLMMEDLQQAYSAYQQALYHLKDPKEPKLWYGIGILYDRYGSLEHAEEAFSQVMRMEPGFEKANEIYFRLGIIYKQQQKFASSLECFKYIVHDPPRPLTEEDIWFQIGHVHEQQKDYDSAKAAYRRVLDRDPKHAKVLQQLGWLHHQESSSFRSQDQAIDYLEQSVSSDNSDAQSWYLLGRCYMSQQKYSKAYEAYQQAVYRDGRNPTFWCSIGVLYYQINQYRDALDAYSRAIRLNPYISEVWYDLGTLYESCNNQTNDALDAYQRAADLDPNNQHIKHRLQLLRNGQASGVPPQHPAPTPQDVHPQQYQDPAVRNGPPGPQWGVPAPVAQPAAQRPPGPGEGWSGQLAAIDNPQQRPPNPYESREAMRGPPPPTQAPPRQPSPRHDPMRPYQDQRSAPRRPSPGPAVNNLSSSSYPPPLPQPSSGGPPQGPARITNPNYTAAAGLATPPAGHNGPVPPPGHGQSPPPEIRPIVGLPEVKQSPSSQQNDYNRGGQSYGQQPSIMQAPPTAALEAAEAAARGRDDRPATGYKRGPDSEDEYNKGPNKKNSNGEPRVEGGYARTSPKDRQHSPPRLQRRSSSEIRREHANQNYVPSEAAHHPPPPAPVAVPPTAPETKPPQQPLTPQQAQPPQPPPVSAPQQSPSSATPQQQQLPPIERPQEGPARKMELDEDYNDAGEDDKRVVANGQGKASPRGLTNGQPKTEST